MPAENKQALRLVMIEIRIHMRQPGPAQPVGSWAGALTWPDAAPQILTASPTRHALLKMSKRVAKTPVDSTDTGS